LIVIVVRDGDIQVYQIQPLISISGIMFVFPRLLVVSAETQHSQQGFSSVRGCYRGCSMS
jgi:hypothetical protein